MLKRINISKWDNTWLRKIRERGQGNDESQAPPEGPPTSPEEPEAPEPPPFTSEGS